MRLVAVVGTVQQHAGSGQAALAVAGLRWALALLFGPAAAATSGAGNTSSSAGTPAPAAAGPAPASAAVASRWLQLQAVAALDAWAKGGSGVEPGGLLANQDLLFADPRLPGLTGGPCPAWKAWYRRRYRRREKKKKKT